MINTWFNISRIKVVVALATVAALLGFLFATTPAFAESPTGCDSDQSGVNIITDKLIATEGETITYSVTAGNVGPNGCDIENRSMTLTLPDGTLTVFGPFNYPFPTTEGLVGSLPYVADSADLVGGFWTANVSWNGTLKAAGDLPSTGSKNISVVPKGHIIVNKVTNPAADQQSFSFDAVGTGYNDFALTDVTAPNDQTLNAGAYSVSETVPAGWTQTSATCVSSLGQQEVETPGALELDAGETITCTFTNTKLGTIIVVKDTVPNDGTDFTFTSATLPGAPFNLDDDSDGTLPNSKTHNNLTPGTFDVAETANANYTTVGSCNDGSPIGAISLQAGETVTCTFTNTLRGGRIEIEKQTTPAGHAQTFGFTGEIVTSLADNGVQGKDVVAGQYTVSETAVAGWTVTSIVCNDGQSAVPSTGTGNTATFNVAPGETVRCVFNNSENPGHIIIVKDAVPNSAQDFVFTNNFANGNPSPFSLDDDADGTLLNSRDSVVLAGTYNVSEGAVAGWTQTSAICSDQSPINAIVVSAGETVTCTFTNTLRQGHIIVDKVTNPSGDTQSFTFVTNDVGYPGFSLTDTAAPNDQTLNAGAYQIAEIVPSGWDLKSATCVSSILDNETPGNLELDAGETITCTFTNTKRGSISGMKFNDLNGNGLKDVGELGLAGWTINLSGNGSAVTDGNGNYSFTNLVAGQFTVSETQQTGWSQTYPALPGTHAITLDAGESEINKDFGNMLIPVVQGCSPGYWKQPQHFGSYPAGIYPNTLFSAVFGGSAFPGKTLLEVLSTGGGGQIALGRIMVGAYLNASTVTGFPYTPAQVIAAFNGATSATYDSVKATFEALQDPCPFGRNPGPAGPGEPDAVKPGKSGSNGRSN